MTEMTEETQQTPVPAPVRPAIVTLDDVRATLEALALDARKTNASVVQKALGRGGMGTVQKHLDMIRAELDKPVAVLNGEIPPTPKEVADAVWRAAYTTTQNLGLAALGAALLERDDARMKLERASGDVVVWEAAKDEADAAAAAAETAKAEAEAKAAAAEAAAEASRIALEAEIAGRAADAALAADNVAKAAHDAKAALSALQAQHDLAISHSETRIATLQGQLDRVNDQLAEVKAEVKSLLHAPAVQQAKTE